MRRAVPLPRIGGSGRCPRTLRERWRQAARLAGWRFADDWAVPAVDAVCEAAAAGKDLLPALDLLGRARAESGAGLEEALSDLAALHTVVDTPRRPGPPDVDGVPTPLVRAVALGWADVIAGELGTSEAVDDLTGLATADYLRTRLGEVYRSGATDRFVLILVTVDRSLAAGWTRWVPMLMLAEAMRAVFDGGQTLALAGPSVAAVLCEREEELPGRVRRLRRLAVELLATDRDTACAAPVRLWVEPLPDDYRSACDLLGRLGG